MKFQPFVYTYRTTINYMLTICMWTHPVTHEHPDEHHHIHVWSFYTYIHSFPGPVSERTLLDSQRAALALQRTSLPSQRTLLPRYVDQPFRPSQIGVKSTKGQDVDNGESIYEDVGPRPLPALPEEDYEPNGYICRVDSIPDSKPAPLGKEKCYTSSSS